MILGIFSIIAQCVKGPYTLKEYIWCLPTLLYLCPYTLVYWEWPEISLEQENGRSIRTYKVAIYFLECLSRFY